MVIAVDNSSASRKAISHGLALASMMKDQPEVNVVYAVGLNPEQCLPISFMDTLDRRNNMNIKAHSEGEIAAIEKWLKQFKKKYVNCRFLALQRHEQVSHIIVQYLYDIRADMLVMGASSRSSTSGLIKTLLGSTCEYCVRHAPCPVSIVKQSDTKDSA